MTTKKTCCPKDECTCTCEVVGKKVICTVECCGKTCVCCCALPRKGFFARLFNK